MYYVNLVIHDEFYDPNNPSYSTPWRRFLKSFGTLEEAKDFANGYELKSKQSGAKTHTEWIEVVYNGAIVYERKQ